uniref:Hexosyltransferase n=1 Tax=Globodera pallida TaxID=36090 RepID=A0A183BNN6_GLOPA
MAPYTKKMNPPPPLLGSVITSAGTRRSARISAHLNCSISDRHSLKPSGPLITKRTARVAHKNEANLKNIWICGDIWLSIFPCLGSAEVALKMALISDRYDALVDTHFKTRKWSIGNVELRRSTNGTGAEIGRRKKSGGLEWFPIQQVPPLKNLIAFNKITICYIDDTVIDFLRRIQHLFNTGITLSNSEKNQSRCWEVIAQNVWPMFKSNVNKLVFNYEKLSKLRTLISPTVLRDCANLRSIHPPASTIPRGLGNDRRGASDGQALSKWLHTPRDDGRPKVLKYSVLGYSYQSDRALVKTLKQAFLKASASLENEQTLERLEFQRVHPTSLFWLLKRGPIARDATKWAEWEREAMVEESPGNQKNVINLSISNKNM